MLRLLVVVFAPCAWGASPWATTIITAAEQRILSQKMTKDLVLIAQDLDVEKHQEDLRKDVAHFSRNLEDLTHGNNGRGVLPAPDGTVQVDLQKVKDVWADFQLLLLDNMDSIRDANGAVNTTVIEEALKYNKPIMKYSAEVVSLLRAQSIVEGEAEGEAALIDLCERQLMLIHEINKEVGLVGLGVNAAYYLEHMLQQLSLFEASHEGILRGAAWAGVPSLTKVCILDLMRVVTGNWEQLKPKLLEIVGAASLADSRQLANSLVPSITSCGAKVLKSMSEVVYSIVDNLICSELKENVSALEWQTAIFAVEDQNYLIAQSTQLFMQIALGFEVARSQVDLTVLTESVAQDFRELIEGNLDKNLIVPPTQGIADLLQLALAAWDDLATELKRAVRSSEIPSTSVKEVARLSRISLSNVKQAVKLYVKAGLISGTEAPVYVVDITAAQRSLLAKLAKETSLLSYGYDPERSWERLNETRRDFLSTHWKLLLGAPATETYPKVEKTKNVCIVQQMFHVLKDFELLEIAALEVARGDAQKLQEVVELEPLAVKEMKVAMRQYSGFNITCDDLSYTDDEWEGLVGEMGKFRALTQEAAVEFILTNEFNGSSDLLLGDLVLESEKRIKFGSRSPIVPPPYSQKVLEQFIEEIDPTLLDFMDALKSADSLRVVAGSISLMKQVDKIKKEFLRKAGASNPSLPIGRIDVASKQIMLTHKIFKEKLIMMSTLNATGISLETSLAEFEANQRYLRDGGNGLDAVILHRFDIFKEYDKVMAKWQVYKDTILEKRADIESIQTALRELIVELEIALQLYTIPDDPLRAEMQWSILAYTLIGVFVCAVMCVACVVYRRYGGHKEKLKQEQAQV